jgi:hypothetical protein
MRAGGMIGLGVLGIEPTRAWAQSIPKSLEEGGTDNDLRARNNIWTDGGAGALMSKTTFRNEIDPSRVRRSVPPRIFDDGVDVAITQSDMLEYFRTQCSANLEGRRHCIRYLHISEMPVLASAKSAERPLAGSIRQGVLSHEHPFGSTC